MLERQYSEVDSSIESSFLLVTTSCSGRVVDNDTSIFGGRVSGLDGLFQKPSLRSFLQSTAGPQASTGTVATVVSNVEKTELLACKTAVCRTVVAMVMFLSLGAIRPPTFFGHFRIVQGTSLRNDQREGKRQRSSMSDFCVLLLVVVGAVPKGSAVFPLSMVMT